MSNLWKPNPVDVSDIVTGSSAPDASFCVALAADVASLNQLLLSFYTKYEVRSTRPPIPPIFPARYVTPSPVAKP